jgi:formylglycine-generating enzyme required for sulfatase activity
VDRLLGDAPESVIHMAIEHRWMHAETTAYILHHLSPEKKRRFDPGPSRWFPTPKHRMIDIPPGQVTLGRDPQEGFGWDNEFTRHIVEVPAFAISRYKVTNQQYRAFVQEGGPVPPFWVQHGDSWWLQTMFGERPLPDDWPVYVSLRLARQYADWAGLALPTEPQFHRAAYGTLTGEERNFPWGSEPANGVHGNFHFTDLDPMPVTASPKGRSAFGVEQLVGNGWEWTVTPFAPYEGFQAYPTYPGYSSRFFDEDHFVVKGASATTARRLLRRSFRNWFRQGYSHAHAGFRCVKNF